MKTFEVIIEIDDDEADPQGVKETITDALLDLDVSSTITKVREL